MNLKEATDQYVKKHKGLTKLAGSVFIDGAQFERERILGMLRSDVAYVNRRTESQMDYKNPEDWADWLQERLEKEDA